MSWRWWIAGCLAIGVATLGFFWRDLCLWQVQANLSARNTPGAKAWFERANWLGTRRDGQSFLAELKVARRSGDFATVEKLLQSAAATNVPTAEIRRERLLAMAQNNQFSPMEGQWPELLRDPRDDGPEIARAYYTWAMLNHNLELATQTLELWHADYPADSEPLFLQGRFYESMLQWALAEDAYRAAVVLKPQDLTLLLPFANALVARLKTEEAAGVYQRCLKLDAKCVDALKGQAQCASASGDFPKAIAILEQALAQDPNDFRLLKEYGEAQLSFGNSKLAVPALEKAYKLIPEHASVAYSLAKALKISGRASEAEPLLQFVSESQPALQRISELERQLRKSPQDLKLRMEIAALTARYVSRRDAVLWYQNLLRISPRYKPAEEALSELERELSNAAAPGLAPKTINAPDTSVK